MRSVCPRIIVAGERGGAGKTMMSIGLLAAWRARQWPCAAFKKGPDYIDSAWLAAASGRVCRNLDTFLMGEQAVARSFRDRAIAGGVNLIEGNRGLFDGMDPAGSFSTAELAKLLDCPVILVLDCKKRTRTTAAVALGCRMLDRDVNVAGVILNRLGTARQERVTRAAVEQTAGLRVLGAVPRLPEPKFRERHLGLVPPQEDGCPHEALEAAREAAERYLDIEAIWNTACETGPLPREAERFAPAAAPPSEGTGLDRPRIGYFLDSAFHFYYPENLEALEAAGAALVPVNAEAADTLPPGLHGFYIGGGFPEERARVLSDNRALRETIRTAAEAGLPIYAECGGLMYLGRRLKTAAGEFPMAGVFPFSTVVENTPQGHGYVEAAVAGPHPFLACGERFRGHEFHYSRPVEWEDENLTFALSLSRGRGFHDGRDGLVHKNTFAAYTHIHAVGEPQWAASLVSWCRNIRRQRSRLEPARSEAIASAAK